MSITNLDTVTARRQRKQRVGKLADFDWTTYYDKQTQEKLLAGFEI
jgi:alpha-L-arabinofuranosidase